MSITKRERGLASDAAPFKDNADYARKAARAFALLAWLTVMVGFSPAASAQESQGPPPSNVEYFQYGVGVAVEKLASGGDVCPAHASTPCIFNSGGGLTIRMGYRSRGPFYLGGAYEATRVDSSNLLRLAILQQLRGEGRFYLDAGNRLTPYATLGFGGALYGNEWNVSTGGPTLSAGLGLEFQVTQSTVLGGSLSYRGHLLHHWADSTGQERADRYLGFGLIHTIGFELTLELRDSLSRW